MKKLLLLSIIYFSFALISAQSGIDGYVYVFADDFNGPHLTENTYYHDKHCAQAGDWSCYDLDPDNFQLVNGCLRLKAIYAPGTHCINSCYNGVEVVRDYIEQNIRTIKNYKYGRYSIRAWIPKTSGLFPAFWFFGGSCHPNLIHLELDFMEMWTIDEKAKTQVWNYDDNGPHDGGHDWWNWTPNIWSTYTFNWNQYDREMYWNENLVSNIYTAGNTDGNGDVIIGAQLYSGDGVGDSFTSGYTYMDIDYLTIEYPIDCDEIITINNYISNDEVNTVYAGKSIETSPNGGTVIVKGKPDPWKEGSNLDFIATDNIILNPGFHAEATSSFRAWIVKQEDINPVKKNESDTGFYHDFDRYVVHRDRLNLKMEESEISSANSTSSSILKNTLSEIESDGGGIDVYPNPTDGIINVMNAESELVKSIEIINMIGRKVKTIQYSDLSHNIDISDLPNGQYYIIVYSKNNIFRVLITKY